MRSETTKPFLKSCHKISDFNEQSQFRKRSNVQAAYGWIKKGLRKEIPANTGRSRINLSGSVDVISHKVIVQEDETLNAESTLGFFSKNRRSLSR